jgi:hypothetical protein
VEIISSLTLMDDLFMKVVLQDKQCTEYILQTILDNAKLKLKKQILQKNLPNLHGHSLILDCLCEDETNNIYNIEIQNNISGAQPKRARYHAALLDMHSLKRGNDFTQLLRSYVIFITAKDVLHGQQQIYHVERIIRESGKPFSDESHIIYFNTSYIDNSPLGKLAEDFHALETSKMHSPILSKRVEVLKSFNANQKGDQEMNVLLEQYRQKALKEGMEKGMEKGNLAKQKVMQLMGLLAEEGRIEDIKKASVDQEYLQNLLLEFDL